MVITSTEKKVLFTKKVKDGKSPKSAENEVLLESDMEVFRKKQERKNKSLNRIIYLKDKQIDELKLKLKEQKSKFLIKKLDKYDEETNNNGKNGHYANTQELSRIMTLLESEGGMTLSDLRKGSYIAKTDRLTNALSFLKRIGTIDMSIEGRATIIKLIKKPINNSHNANCTKETQ